MTDEEEAEYEMRQLDPLVKIMTLRLGKRQEFKDRLVKMLAERPKRFA